MSDYEVIGRPVRPRLIRSYQYVDLKDQVHVVEHVWWPWWPPRSDTGSSQYRSEPWKPP